MSKCPLFIMTDVRAQLGEETEIGNCIEAECAWYLQEIDSCCIPAISPQLEWLADVIEEIKQRKRDRSKR